MAERLQYVRLSAKACAVEHEDTIPSELYEGLLDLSLPHDTRYTSGCVMCTPLLNGFF